jgi:hypothetical protein
MHGFFLQPLQGGGAEPVLLWGSFAPDGTDDPDSDDNEGPPGFRAFTVTEADTGAFTVTLPEGYTPVGTPIIVVSPSAAGHERHWTP